MRIIIVFSSPNHDEFDIWQPLIDDNSGYIPVNDSSDKIYAFDGHENRYRANGVWMTENLINEINKIIEDNNNCECACILHDYAIPDGLTSSFTDIRFKSYSRADSEFYSKYIESFNSDNKQNCFDQLWDELHKKQAVVEAPKKGTKAYARKLTKYHIIHDCDNVITCLSVQIDALKKDSGSSKRNGKEIVLEYQNDFVKVKYERAISAYNEIVRVFPDNPEINEIPGKLANAMDKYASIYRKAEEGDDISNKIIIKNWEMIKGLHKETIDILEKEVLKNGEENL
jgi:hypothetical protein